MSSNGVEQDVLTEMELQYQPSNWDRGGLSEDPSAVLRGFWELTVAESALVKRELGCTEVTYGQHPNQKLDLFGLDLPDGAPLFVFVHGGYWSAGSREHSSWMVKAFRSAGIASAIVGYRLGPEATLDEIVSDVRAALQYLQKHLGRRTWVCGHSAGAHLLAAAILRDPKIPALLVEGFIGISGVYDLEPLKDTSIAKDANIDGDCLLRNSVLTAAAKMKDRSKKGAILVVGAWESTKGFIHQTNLFAEELRRSGVDVRVTLVEKRNHFTVVADLRHSDYSLTKEIISEMTAGL